MGISNETHQNLTLLNQSETGLKDITGQDSWGPKICPSGQVLVRGECVVDGDGNSCDCGSVTNSCN